MKYIKIIILTCIYVFIIISTNAQQKKVDLTNAFMVGDIFIPPNDIQQIRGTGSRMDFQKLKDKVVILDFFDTFCGTCIQAMPKLQKLQDKLKDKVQIITVAWQDKVTLEKFFERNEFLKENKVNLPVIYSDVYLKNRFPHQTVPHVVFLYKGKVQAISGHKVITEEHILRLFDQEKIDLPLKDDFANGNLLGRHENEVQIKGMVKLSGYLNGIPFESIKKQKDTVTGLQKTSFYNVSIYSAVLSSWAKIKKADYIPRPERLVLKVKNINRYEDIDQVGDMWYTQNAISYERLDGIQRTDSAQAQVVLNDLRYFLGIRTYKEMKRISCLILKPCPITLYKGKKMLDGMTYNGSAVFAVMTDMGDKFPPVLDLVKSKEKIKVGPYDTLQELNEQLAHYGIVAEIGMGDQEVLVIEEIEE